MVRLYEKMKEERIKKEVAVIKDLYDMAFTMKDADILDLGSARLQIDFGETEKSLMEATKLIYRQIKVLAGLMMIKDRIRTYPELHSRLVQVYKQLKDLLKREFKVSNAQVVKETGEVEYILET